MHNFIRVWRRIIPRLLIGVLGIAAIAIGIQGFQELADVDVRRESLQAQIAELEARAKRYQDEIRLLREDPVGLELYARLEHQLVEPGEVVLLLRFRESASHMPHGETPVGQIQPEPQARD